MMGLIKKLIELELGCFDSVLRQLEMELKWNFFDLIDRRVRL